MGTRVGPTDRWYPMVKHPERTAAIQSEKRFKILHAGRRSYKSEIAKRWLVSLIRQDFREGKQLPYFYAAPTHQQVKRVAWKDLKDLVPPSWLAGSPSETDLLIKTKWGAQIELHSLDKAERMEGVGYGGGVVDEYGNAKGDVWDAHIRPALSDHKGPAMMIGVPEGRNHYYEKHLGAISGELAEWGSWGWHSDTVLDADEIRNAKAEMDELVFRQEYGGEFVSWTGKAYHAFDPDLNCRTSSHSPLDELWLCFDFNISPGVAAIIQPRDDNTDDVIGEVWIPRHSNTRLVCERLREDWGDHQGQVYCYGDTTGGNPGSAKVMGSDWDIVEDMLRPTFGDRLRLRVPAGNPRERARVNTVNKRLANTLGERKLFIDGEKAPHVVRDLDGVPLLEGGNGQLDKKHDPALTHISDAIGYCLHYEYGGWPAEEDETADDARIITGIQ